MTHDRFTGRIKIITKLLLAHQEEAQATQTLHNAQALALGMHPTDLVCLHHLLQFGPCPTGDLTALTKLTTGAMTSVIDRLERTGYVRREMDKKDRRKVLVKAVPHKCKRLLTQQGVYLEHAQKLLGHYTLEELAIITDFLMNMADLQNKETGVLKG